MTDDLIDYRAVTTASVEPTTDAAIVAADALIAKAMSAAGRDDATFDEVIGRLDRAEGDAWDAGATTSFMARVHPDADVRAAGLAAEERLKGWRAGLPLRDDLADAILGYAASADAAALGDEQRRVLDRWLRDIRRAGHGLPDETRAELRSITERLVALESAFEGNLGEWSDGLDLTRDDLVGLPDTYIERLAPGSTPGTFRVSMDYPDYYPFLEGSPRRDLRQALLERFANRATDQNRPLLEEALGLRRRKAAQLGYPSWADYRMEPNMAGSPDRVVALHESVVPVLQGLATDEYAEMARRLQADDGTADLRSWDVSYYDKRILADEFGVDADEVSTYLPLDAAFDGLLALTAEVFDLAFVESAEPRAWHADVRLLDVRDGTSGEHLGWCYADLHPRPGKFGHAMAWPVRLARLAEDGSRVGGISAIVMNVPRGTSDAPALLRHDDVETLFHEFGHVLHEVLGRNAYFRTSMWGVEEDFAEAISQIMENWAWDARILRRFARHHQTGAPLPEALARRIEGSRNVDLGSNYLRTFISYGDLDLRLHGPDPVDIEVAMSAADATRLLPTVEGSFWPASFGHIMAGYDAGYYGYLWSLVFGDDLWSRFEAEGVTDPTVGADYRRDLLECGGMRDAEAMVESFLGRPSSNEAFLRRLRRGRPLAAS